MPKQVAEFDMTVDSSGHASVLVPEGSEIVGVRMEGTPGAEVIKLLCISDPEQPPFQRNFLAVSAGQFLPDLYKKFIGTFKLVPPTGEQFFFLFEV